MWYMIFVLCWGMVGLVVFSLVWIVLILLFNYWEECGISRIRDVWVL